MRAKENFIIEFKGQFPLLTDFYPAEGKKLPVIVYCHGYKGFKDWGHLPHIPAEFNKSGFNFLKFNFSHNGTTLEKPTEFSDLDAFGRNNYSIELQDVQNVLKWLDSDKNEFRNHIDLSRIFLMGHSRGAAISILTAAADKRIKKLTTWSTVSDLGRRFPTGKKLDQWKKNGVIYVDNFRTEQNLPHYYQFYEDYLSNKDRFDIKSAEQSLTIPHLLIHGTQDESVFLGEALHLMSQSEYTSLIKINKGTHTFGASHPYNRKTLPEHVLQAVKYSVAFFSMC